MGGKAVAEFLLALALLVASAPILLATVALIRLTSRGPAFFKQTRVGLRGRVFTIYKLRTMRHDCERHSGPRWSLPGDPRVTLLGRVLRRTHLDELPQLWNVLRGEMSLVGPRPERPEFVGLLERELPLYRLRLQVRPGLTGLAQVQLPPDSDLISVRRKLACDIFYVRHTSWWLDVRILAGTALHLAHVPAWIIQPLLQLPGGTRVESMYENLGRRFDLATGLQSA
jgi:lipopolysaccharide/colanic/teichoic acid biosynthesis glycosyltransferase